jgi:Xaa-Pro dipeptidase
MTYATARKIDPKLWRTDPNVTPTISHLARSEWSIAGLEEPNCEVIRDYRLSRLRQHVNQADVSGRLMFDPMNIRCITDSTNMILWNHHNPFRAALFCSDGYLVILDYRNRVSHQLQPSH